MTGLVVLLALQGPGATPGSPMPEQARTYSDYPFAVGERFEYDARIGLLKLGEGYMEVSGIDTLRGVDITFTTTATTDEEGRALLKAFNFPFRS